MIELVLDPLKEIVCFMEVVDCEDMPWFRFPPKTGGLILGPGAQDEVVEMDDCRIRGLSRFNHNVLIKPVYK